jgi:hypothetical protein
MLTVLVPNKEQKEKAASPTAIFQVSSRFFIFRKKLDEQLFKNQLKV